MMARRMVHIQFDIMPFNIRCLLSGSHLGVFSLMMVHKGEMKAVVMLDSISFFMKIKKGNSLEGLALVYQVSSPTASNINTPFEVISIAIDMVNSD